MSPGPIARGEEMDPNRLTQKSQEAIHDAQTKALRFGHTEVDVEHLLLALLDQRDGLIPRLLTRMGTDTDGLRADVEQALERRPRVSGSGASGDVRVSRALAQVLESAEQEGERLKDDYVSVEHLLSAALEARGERFARHGVKREGLLPLLTQ